MNKHKRHILRQRQQKRSHLRQQSVTSVNVAPAPSAAPPSCLVIEEANCSIVPYDENLLERSRTQWQFGDWDSLAQLSRDTLQHHPDRAKLALLAAAGLLQKGENSSARQFVRLAQDWGCSKKLISQILTAGVYNTLGRAAAVGGQEQRALGHFEKAIATGTPGSDVSLVSQARATEQTRRFGCNIQSAFSLDCDTSATTPDNNNCCFKKTRLIFFTSITEIVTAMAVLRKRSNHNDSKCLFVFYGRPISISGLLREEVISFCKRFLFNSELTNIAGQSNNIDLSYDYEICADEIYISCIRGELEELILNKWKNAKIILFDNGLVSHDNNAINLNYLDRVNGAYYSLLDFFPPPEMLINKNINIHELDSNDLRNEFKYISGYFMDEISKLSGVSQAYLVLGTSFNRTPFVTFDEEKDVYLNFIRKLLADGRKVIYKPHHREKIAMIENHDDPNLHILQTSMPIEILPLFVNIAGTYSVSSTALLTLKKIYGIPAFIIGKNLLPKEKFRHAYKLRDCIGIWDEN